MDDLTFLQDLHDAIARGLPRALRGYLDPTLILLGAAALGVLARFTVFRWLRKLTVATQRPYDDIIVQSLMRRVIAWTVLGTMYVQAEELPWRGRSTAVAQDIIAAVLILSVTLVLVRMVSAVVVAYGNTRAAGVGGTTLIRYVVTTVVLFVGIVSVLALFGISIVPAVTALGIGGLAVALAFQDTLANVFSGLNLSLARQIRVGDYIELGGPRDGLVDGFVVDIGWRATTLRTLMGLQVFIPNKKLAESIMANYTRDPGMSIELGFRVGLDCDPFRVEAVMLDEMQQAIAAVPGIRPDEPATVRFKAFADWSLEFKIYVAIVSFQDRFFIHHELMKRLHRRLQLEKIVVPIPGQRVQLEGPPSPPAV